MLRLSSVFANGALFQHSAPLWVKGESTAESVEIRIERDGLVLSYAEGKTQENGRFSVSVNTPEASFAPCSMIITAGEDRSVLSDVIFGELWLAGGQSNMEMPNSEQIEYEKGQRPRFASAGIRAYQPTPIPLDEDAFDMPDFFGEGEWTRPDEKAFENASALASVFCAVLSETLGVPCGFLNINRGATRIETWLPLEALTEEIVENQKKIGRYPTKENWNTYAHETTFLYKNFNQISACERRMVAPLYGVSVRGAIWFQGCSNCMTECNYGMYAKMLSLLRDIWQERFGIQGEDFPFLFSTLYPYPYESETIAHGRFNQALVGLAANEPEKYQLITNYDLSPIWSVHTKNHPVHSSHKYALGERFARVALASVYRGEERCDAALLADVERCDGYMLLHFLRVTDTLSFKDGNVRGLYVAGEDGKYLPACAEVVSPDTLRVWHPAIAKPTEAVYAMLSNEIYACTLQANGMAVAPFLTAPRKSWPDIEIQARPWCDLTRDYDYQYRTAIDAQPRAIYNPLENSGVCYDDINSLGKRSLHVYGEEKEGVFGAFYRSRSCAKLDFEKYSALSASVFPARALTPSLVLTFSDGSTHRICGVRVSECEKPEWAEYRFAFDDLPATPIARFEFVFEAAKGECPYANIDNIYLIP